MDRYVRNRRKCLIFEKMFGYYAFIKIGRLEEDGSLKIKTLNKV